jgi:hypothetical protein
MTSSLHRDVLKLAQASVPNHRYARLSRRLVRRALYACFVAVLFSAIHGTALASCGADVVAHPIDAARGTHGEMAGGAMSHTEKGMPHIPTPCERGFCHSPTQLPIAPPSVPTTQSFDQLYLQLSSTSPLSTASRAQLLSMSTQPLPGFQRRLDRPPESAVIS